MSKYVMIGGGLAVMLTAMAASADTLKVRGKDYTCTALQELIQEHGEVFVEGNLLGGGLTYVLDDRLCDRDEYAHPAYTASKGKTFCYVGRVCRDSHDD